MMTIRTGRRSVYVPTNSISALHRLLSIHGDDQISATLERAAERYLRVIEHSLPDLSVAEWCMVFDSLMGIWVSDEASVTVMGEAVLERMDMDELDRKWDVDGGRMRQLLTALSYAERQAVAEMVELFRKEGRNIDGTYTDKISRLLALLRGCESPVADGGQQRMSPDCLGQ